MQAYKNVRKIIKLVRLLALLHEVDHNEEAEILSVVADFALKAADFESCLTIADILMTSQPHSESACKVCAQLVASEGFKDVEAKARLASFCMTYCSDDMIGGFLLHIFFIFTTLGIRILDITRKNMFRDFTFSLTLAISLGPKFETCWTAAVVTQHNPRTSAKRLWVSILLDA